MSRGAAKSIAPAIFRSLDAEAAPDWLSTRRASVRPVAFTGGGATAVRRMPSERAPRPASIPVPAQFAEPSIPPPPAAPSLDTPPPGSGSILPPSGAQGGLELELRTEAFAEAAVELAAARHKELAQIEGPLLQLAVDIAEAIVERELAADPELHRALAQAALTGLGDMSEATLRASREAFAAISDVFGSPSVSLDGVTVAVKLDPALDGLGCVADNGAIRVDGRVSERLRSIRRALEDERRRRALEGSE